MQLNLTNKRILITGGTGTLGEILSKKLLKQIHLIKGIIVFSRDEYNQARIARRLQSPHPAAKFSCCFESQNFFSILEDSRKHLPGRGLKKMTDFSLGSSENPKFLSSIKLKKLTSKKSDKKAYNSKTY